VSKVIWKPGDVPEKITSRKGVGFMPAGNSKLKAYIMLFIVITLPVTLFTDENEDMGSDETEIYEMEDVVVTATRTETEILDVPLHITVITNDVIQASGAKNVAEILALQSGITLQDYGPEGAQQNISIRGSGSNGVLVLINGVRLNDSRSGGMDLSLIPLNSIEKIEIVRGGTSALYGADAVGGIINIITKKRNKRKLEINLENRSYIPGNAVAISEGGIKTEVDEDWMDLFDTQEANVGYSDKIGEADIITCGGVTNAQNEYVWYDSEDTGDYRRKTNAELFKTDLYTGISFPLLSGKWNIAGLFHYSTKGLPGSLTWPSTDAQQTDINGNGSVQYNTKNFFTPCLTMDIKVFYKYATLNYQDPDETYPSEDLHTTNTLGFDTTQEFLYFDQLSFVYGLNFFYDSVESTQIDKRDRTGIGIFLETPIFLTSFFTVTPVIRYDIYSDFPNDITFKLGSVYNISDSASIKSCISKAYRAPTFNDLYWPVSGNTDLVSETAYNADIGFSLVRDQISIDLFGYIRWMKDEIKWNPDESGTWRPFNLGETLYPGIESSFRITLWERVKLNMNYTFIYSFVLKGRETEYTFKDNMRVPYVPVHSASIGFEYKDKGNTLELNTRLESERWHDETNDTRINPYWLMNVKYERFISDNFNISFGVENISTGTIQTINGYPMPPVSIKTGIELLF